MVTTRKGTSSQGSGEPRGRGRGRGRGKRAKAEQGEAGDDPAAQAAAAKRAKADDAPQAAPPQDQEARQQQAQAAGEHARQLEPEASSRQPEPVARQPEPETRQREPETRAAEPETRQQEPESRQPEKRQAESEARAQEPEAHQPVKREKPTEEQPLPAAHGAASAKKEEKQEAFEDQGQAAGAAGAAGKAPESKKSSFPPGHKPVVLERGHIFFFYKPKVEHEAASSADDVKRLYMVLKPQPGSSVGAGLKRLLLVAKKRLPAVEGRKETIWCFVRKASKDEAEVMGDLEAETYSTKTLGERHQEAARPAGEGVYGLIMHEGHAHLAYFLTVPLDPGEVQEELNIRREASFIVQVKNPENPERQRNMPTNFPGFEGLGERGRPDYPEELMVGFENLSSEQHKRFSSNEDLPKFLDVVGTELLLIGAKADVVGELRAPAEEIEKAAAKEVQQVEKQQNPEAKLTQDLPSVSNLNAPMEPAVRGTWA